MLLTSFIIVCVILSSLIDAGLYSIEIPEYSHEIAMIHLKLDRIIQALKIENIDYQPSYHPKNPSKPINNINNKDYLSSINKNGNSNIYGKGNALNGYSSSASGAGSGDIKSAKEAEFAKDKHFNSEKEKELYGNSDKLKYLGNNKNQDAILNQEAYLNNEGFDKGKYHISDQTVNQTGSRFEQRTRSTRTTNATLLGDIETNFRDKKGIENHEGNYEGNEFNVGYNLEKQNAKFKDFENNKKFNQNVNVDGNIREDINDGGKFDESKYDRYTDKEKDEEYRKKAFNSYPNGPGNGKGYPNEYNEDEGLYGKFSGKGKSSPKEYGQPRDYDGFERYRKKSETSIDDDNRERGDSFNNKAFAKQGFGKEQNVGFNTNAKGNEYINEGELVKVQANGNNKRANYKGNYKTSDQFQDKKDKTEQRLFFTQRGQNIDPASPNRNSLEVRDTVTYNNFERKGKRDIVHFDGRYQDAAKKKKLNNDEYKKIYAGDEFYDDVEVKKDNKKRLIGREKSNVDGKKEYKFDRFKNRNNNKNNLNRKSRNDYY